MEEAAIVRAVYDPLSYYCFYYDSIGRQQELGVLSVQLQQDKYLALQLERFSFTKQDIPEIHCLFYGSSLSSERVCFEEDRPYLYLLVSEVVRVLHWQRSLPPRCPSSSQVGGSNGKKHKKRSAAAVATLKLLQPVEQAELERSHAEDKLWKLALKKAEPDERQAQRLLLKKLKKSVITLRKQQLPQLTPLLPNLLQDTLQKGVRPAADSQLRFFWEKLQLPLTGLSSKQLYNKYGDWLRSTRLAVLSLPDRPLQEHIMVYSPAGSPHPFQPVRSFAVNWSDLSSGSLSFFVTQLDPDAPRYSLGVFRFRLIVGRPRVEYGQILVQHLTADSSLLTLAEQLTQPRQVTSHIYSSLLTGTSYVLAQELLPQQQQPT